MKKSVFLFLPLLCGLTSCDLFSPNNDKIHTNSYEAITGKFVLHEARDKRVAIMDTYFVIDGSKGNFSIKYYENGTLKKDGLFNRVLTYEEKIGYWTDNLHFNIKFGDAYEHISAYTESFEPLDQFRILDEYTGGSKEKKYRLSELPFVLGTYVREGKEYKEESANKNKNDYTKPTLENYTSQLDGKYALDENHYFYFVSPKGFVSKDGPYLDSYFQYYSSQLEKPLEGFAHGITYKDSYAPPRLYLTYSDESSYYKSLEDTMKVIDFGYTTFKEDDTMVEHWGSIDFSDGQLKSFAFEHLSRRWTEQEWDLYTKDENAKLPDAILYEYVGGEYFKVES